MDAQIIGIAALAVTLPFILGLVRHLTSKPTFTDIDRERLNDLHEWHDNTDPNTGLKRWYNTSDQHEMTRALVSTLKEIQYSQRDMSKTLERITGVLDKLVDKMDK